MQAKIKRAIYEWVEAILVAAVIAVVIRTFIASPFKIPTSSMWPTLMAGDRIFVSKFTYRFKEPQRTDIIVFRYPEDPKRAFIKRLVAFGGEKVQIKDGDIIIDGEIVTRSEGFKGHYYYNRDPFGGRGRPVKVPEQHFYVLGDNSKDSRDSRYWGFVPKKNLIGKASFIWWPLRRMGMLE